MYYKGDNEHTAWMNERMNKRRKNTRFSTYIFIQILMDKRLHLHIHKQKSSNDSKSLRFFLQRDNMQINCVKEGRKKKTTRRSSVKNKKNDHWYESSHILATAATAKCDAIPRNAIAYCCIRLCFFSFGYIRVWRCYFGISFISHLCVRIVFLFKFLIVSVTKWIVFYSHFKSNARAI